MIKLPADYAKLSPAQRQEAREEYYIRQNGKCWYCKGSLDAGPPKRITGMRINWYLFPGGKAFLRHSEHLHHSHETGLTIGVVHAYCNAVLWQYEDE